MKRLSVVLVAEHKKDVVLTRDAVFQNQPLSNLFTFFNPEAAMEYLVSLDSYPQLSKPDILIVDIDLSQKDDLEALLELKMASTIRNVPVVFLKTSVNRKFETMSLKMLADVFCEKPIEGAHLFNAVGLDNRPPSA